MQRRITLLLAVVAVVTALSATPAFAQPSLTINPNSVVVAGPNDSSLVLGSAKA